MSGNGSNASTSGQTTPDIVTIDNVLYPLTEIIEIVIDLRPPTTVEEVEDGEETYVDAKGSDEGNDSDQENVSPLPIPPRLFTGVPSIYTARTALGFSAQDPRTRGLESVLHALQALSAVRTGPSVEPTPEPELPPYVPPTRVPLRQLAVPIATDRGEPIRLFRTVTDTGEILLCPTHPPTSGLVPQPA